ncbi:23S rRNA (pseudouridine(1915)-N(3))-methyltransferase RlmH [Marinithermus hydrothermalis]|uniref:23S rRNA (pseudouridine(1915)-N(3))-methyltransferase RlmH n=1 Tax=Marinithermus hydrothermalis TaxID=186192 RepID=UPI0005A052FE|nr:23S rRNA (pseudouridine(1915)-N(3))-methyltransferase RlmH [Marinithermus hydrothermalis]
MRWLVLTIGKPKLAYAKSGVAEYVKRITRYTRFELRHLREDTPEQEAARLLAASQGCYRIVLDERGDRVTTLEFVERVNRWERQGLKNIAVLIGGAEGHPEALRRQADWLLSLSPFTLQHELALLIFLEQLYRVHTIKRNEPYHR